MDKYLLVILFHLFLIVPMFLFVGFQRAATPEWLYKVVFAAGILVLLYHGAKAAIRLYKKSPVAWINLVHAGLVAPLLLFIGWHEKQTPRPAYELLLMSGFAVLGYHLKNLVVVSQTFVQGATE